MRKALIPLFAFLLAAPAVVAQGETCGLSNIAVCLPQKFFEFLLSIINAPLQPFLALTKTLLTEAVNITLFAPVWAIIIYIISLFYGLFLLFAGFNFMISGYDAAKRENAKHLLKNIILMIFFVQASYFLYELVLQLAATLTAGIISMVNPDFFLLTADNIGSLALELTLSLPYLLTLLTTIILLTLRYLFVAVGVVFFPLGIFFSFIDALESFGKLILNTLAVLIFLPFFQAIVLLAASKMLEASTFESLKIIVMISAFLLINTMMLFLTLFAVIKAVKSAAHSTIGKVIVTGIKSVI